MIWRLVRWNAEDTLAAFDAARLLCREAGKADARTVTAVEKLAKSDRRIASTVEQWDANPLLAGTPGGVLDLRTGEIRPARREDYITKLTGVTRAPRLEHGGAPPDLWLSFPR
jgi:putative DNA primase/helicase